VRRITIGVKPGAIFAKIFSINITPTLKELDKDFFDIILPDVKEVVGIMSNLAEVKKQANALFNKKALKLADNEKEKADRNPVTEKGKKSAANKANSGKKQPVTAAAPGSLFEEKAEEVRMRI